MAMFAILMCVNFASCSNDGNEVPEQGKEIMVSLGFSGDFEISESPLSRATSDDLYLIRVQKKNGSSYTSYAYGLFDDIESLEIMLTENATYGFQAAILKDGKNRLYNSNGSYGLPFSTSITVGNSFTYSNTTSASFVPGDYKLSDGSTYGLPNVDTYITPSTVDYTPTEENTSVQLQMLRQSFGVNFIAEDITKGSLKIEMSATKNSGGTLSAPSFELTSNSSSLEDIFYMPFSAIIQEDGNPKMNASVKFTWVIEDGNEVVLGTPTITFERNMKTTIKIKVAEDIESGIGFTYYDESNEMGDGGTYNVDGDTATKE